MGVGLGREVGIENLVCPVGFHSMRAQPKTTWGMSGGLSSRLPGLPGCAVPALDLDFFDFVGGGDIDPLGGLDGGGAVCDRGSPPGSASTVPAPVHLVRGASTLTSSARTPTPFRREAFSSWIFSSKPRIVSLGKDRSSKPKLFWCP